MQPNKRIIIMSLIFVVLIGANLVVRLGDGGFESNAFWLDSGEMTLSGKASQHLDVLKKSPSLDFNFKKSSTTVDFQKIRNPFIFGIDPRKEAEQRQRLKELEAAREQVEVVQPEPVPLVVDEKPGFDGQLLGILENQESGDRQVALSFKDEIHILGIGDILAKQFEIVAIDYRRVHLRRLQDREDIKLDVE